MVDFIISVQLKIFDPVISDPAGGDLVFRQPNSTKCLDNLHHVCRPAPIHLNRFFLQHADIVIPTVPDVRFDGKVLFLAYGCHHNKWRLRRIEQPVAELRAVKRLQRFSRAKAVTKQAASVRCCVE